MSVADQVRFYTDQHIPGAVSQGLRRREIDVKTAQETQMCGAADADQLAFALGENRVLVSFDPDFLALHQGGAQHAGIAWCQATKYSIGQLIQALLLVHGVLDAQSMRNHVEYL
jgi:hypothetical protein